jgi:hypothetical protein
MRSGPSSARTKATRIQTNHTQEIGDTHTFIALERHTKLILALQLGERTRFPLRITLPNSARLGGFPISNSYDPTTQGRGV